MPATAVEKRENAKRKSAPKSSPDEATLKDALKDFDASWKYCENGFHDRWMNNYRLYHGERVKRGYDGISDTFVPMPFSTVETLNSALFGSKPKFNFLPPKNKPDQKTDILNAALDYYWEKDQWSVKTITTGRSFLINGNGQDYFAWDVDHPVMINVPLRDFIIDPTAPYLDERVCRYVGRRYLTTIDELEDFEIVDFENPIHSMDESGQVQSEYNTVKKYKNLDKLKNARDADNTDSGTPTTDATTDKQEKDIFYGSTVGPDAPGQVEVIELWYEDKVISIANRTVIIEDTENYYKAKARANGEEFPKGILPVAAARNYTDESLFYAKGEIDFIADQAEMLNDLTNQNIDAITYALNPMYTLDPKYADQIEEVENLPGAVYPFEQNALMPIQMANIPQDAFNERQNIKSEIRETTASNEIVKGAAAEGGKTTATEINAQVAGASNRLNLKITQIENEYFYRMAKIVFTMIRLYVTQPMLVRIVGKDGVHWETFDPEDFADGEYEPRIQLDIEIQNDKQQAATNAKEMYAAFLNDPDVNQVELKKLVLAKGFQMDPDEVEQLMQPNPAMMGGMPGQAVNIAPAMLNQPGQQGSEVSDLPPEVMSQLPPDATPEELQMIREAMAQQGQAAPA